MTVQRAMATPEQAMGEEQAWLKARVRLAGAILIGGFVASIIWRIILAPVLLGDFSPVAMPPHQRAALALGLLVSALVAASGLAVLAHALREAHAGRLVAGAGYAAFAGAALLAVNIGMLSVGADFLGLFLVFAFLTTGSWIVTSVALFRDGILHWSALGTAILAALAMLSLVTGATVIFIMFVTTLPMAMGLLLWRPRTTVAAATVAIPTRTV
jgi:hypothetical protein